MEIKKYLFCKMSDNTGNRKSDSNDPEVKFNLLIYEIQTSINLSTYSFWALTKNIAL